MNKRHKKYRGAYPLARVSNQMEVFASFIHWLIEEQGIITVEAAVERIHCAKRSGPGPVTDPCLSGLDSMLHDRFDQMLRLYLTPQAIEAIEHPETSDWDSRFPVHGVTPPSEEDTDSPGPSPGEIPFFELLRPEGGTERDDDQGGDPPPEGRNPE